MCQVAFAEGGLLAQPAAARRCAGRRATGCVGLEAGFRRRRRLCGIRRGAEHGRMAEGVQHLAPCPAPGWRERATLRGDAPGTSCALQESASGRGERGARRSLAANQRAEPCLPPAAWPRGARSGPPAPAARAPPLKAARRRRAPPLHQSPPALVCRHTIRTPVAREHGPPDEGELRQGRPRRLRPRGRRQGPRPPEARVRRQVAPSLDGAAPWRPGRARAAVSGDGAARPAGPQHAGAARAPAGTAPALAGKAAPAGTGSRAHPASRRRDRAAARRRHGRSGRRLSAPHAPLREDPAPDRNLFAGARNAGTSRRNQSPAGAGRGPGQQSIAHGRRQPGRRGATGRDRPGARDARSIRRRPARRLTPPARRRPRRRCPGPGRRPAERPARPRRGRGGGHRRRHRRVRRQGARAGGAGRRGIRPRAAGLVCVCALPPAGPHAAARRGARRPAAPCLQALAPAARR
jgi:hypothetical protein